MVSSFYFAKPQKNTIFVFKSTNHEKDIHSIAFPFINDPIYRL